MQEPLRRKDREKDEDFALDVLQRCSFATLAMTQQDGTPYCIPISPALVGRSLYFHCAHHGMKTDALRARPEVCVSAACDVTPVPEELTTEYASAVAFGCASEVIDDAEKVAALRAICERYAASNLEAFPDAIERSLARTAIWRVDIENITGKGKRVPSAAISDENAGTSILLINDMAGYGKVALSVMIPVLSAMKLNVYNLPTALVSNTLDYGRFDILDTTSYMEHTLQIWDELDFAFDAVATGFLVSEEQSLLVSGYCRACKAKGIPVFVDPIMGDEGVLYNGMTETSVAHMRNMCGVADIIMPNMTEAEYLTGLHVGKRSLSLEEVHELAQALHKLGSKAVVITSVVLDTPLDEGDRRDRDHLTYVSEGTDASTDSILLPYDEIPVRLPGTGDIFSSVLIGRYLGGHSLSYSVQAAMDSVVEMLKVGKDSEDRYRGVPIEQYLDRLR